MQKVANLKGDTNLSNICWPFLANLYRLPASFWLAETNLSFYILGKAATSDPASIKSHFEELYSQKKDKQPDLETIKNTIAGLLGDPQATDKSNIRDVQSEVCSQWHDFTELLIDLIVMQVRDQCYFYCLFYIFDTRCCWLTMYWCTADGNIRQQFPSLYRETRVHAL